MRGKERQQHSGTRDSSSLSFHVNGFRDLALLSECYTLLYHTLPGAVHAGYREMTPRNREHTWGLSSGSNIPFRKMCLPGNLLPLPAVRVFILASPGLPCKAQALNEEFLHGSTDPSGLFHLLSHRGFQETRRRPVRQTASVDVLHLRGNKNCYY